MSYGYVWHDKVVERLRNGELDAVNTILNDDSGSSSSCEYVMAKIIKEHTLIIKNILTYLNPHPLDKTVNVGKNFTKKDLIDMLQSLIEE